MAIAPPERVKLPLPKAHSHAQDLLIRSPKKRTMVRAGRRFGKTRGLAIKAVRAFLQGRRVLYAAPTADQLAWFWFHCKAMLTPLIDAKLLEKNETEHRIEWSELARPANREARIRAKTAWNAETLRGDYADELILDEFQLMNETAWNEVGAPMLLDNGGNATFCYTPPSFRSRSASKARDKQHAAKMFAARKDDPEWACLTFRTSANPTISAEALGRARQDMSALAYRQEIMAEDVEEAAGALWKRGWFGPERYRSAPESLARIVIGVDPTGTTSGDECGIIAAGIDDHPRGYVLGDRTIGGVTPRRWAYEVLAAYDEFEADSIVAETNFGGDMVEETLLATGRTDFHFIKVTASRGKAVRAQPVATRYGKLGTDMEVFHTHAMPELEDQMCLWEPTDKWSPDRLDAAVFALTELMPPEQPWSII